MDVGICVGFLDSGFRRNDDTSIAKLPYKDTTMNILSVKNIKLFIAVSMAVVAAALIFPIVREHGFPQAILISWVAAVIGFGMTLWVISVLTD